MYNWNWICAWFNLLLFHSFNSTWNWYYFYMVYKKWLSRTGEFKNPTQQMINFIFVKKKKKNTNDYRLKNEL